MSEADIEGSTGGASPARQEPSHLRRALIIWAVLSVIGIAVWLAVAPFVYPPALVASTLSGTDDFTFVVLTALSVPVAMFVFVFLGYSLFTFRVKERPTEDGVPLQPRPSLQIGWLSVTGGLCLFLLIWGFTALYLGVAATASNTLIVRVTGQQWMWTFNYPQYGLSSQSQVIELPVNRPVQFVVTSNDVLHGFAIRALGIRIDANPGQVTTTPIITPTQMGNYSVYCVELCGLYHSYMWQAVNVVDNASFNSWVLSQGGHL